MALLAVTVLWDVLGLWRGGSLWWAMSFWTMAVGAASALPAAAVGFWDYIAIPREDRAAAVALRHMLIMLSGVSAYAGSLLVRGGASRPTDAALTIPSKAVPCAQRRCGSRTSAVSARVRRSQPCLLPLRQRNRYWTVVSSLL